MSKLFKKLFIKNYQDVENPAVRATYGLAAGILGIVANTVLFSVKLLAGILSGSIAVIADAINNLSDFMTSVITIIGFKISSRPADKEHPFGHERFEYVTSLIVACVIFFIGIETGRAAIEKILSSSVTEFSIITCVILGASVVIKLCLSLIFKSLGKDVNSETLNAMSTDSRNDVISTGIVLICAIVSMIWGVSLDEYLGVAVSLLVIISAIKLIKETVDPLLGTPPDKEFIKKIENKLKSYEGVLDIHDLIVHSYGPTKTFASVHIEVDSNVDIITSHDLSDKIERDFYRDMKILLVCHLDPVSLSDTETLTLKEELKKLLFDYNTCVTLHDFRVVVGTSHTSVIFDVVIPCDLKNAEKDICKLVNAKLATYDKKYHAVIEFDKNYA